MVLSTSLSVNSKKKMITGRPSDVKSFSLHHDHCAPRCQPPCGLGHHRQRLEITILIKQGSSSLEDPSTPIKNNDNTQAVSVKRYLERLGVVRFHSFTLSTSHKYTYSINGLTIFAGSIYSVSREVRHRPVNPVRKFPSQGTCLKESSGKQQ